MVQLVKLLKKKKLRLELSSYNEYKIQKEEEINKLSIKIKNLLNKLYICY